MNNLMQGQGAESLRLVNVKLTSHQVQYLLGQINDSIGILVGQISAITNRKQIAKDPNNFPYRGDQQQTTNALYSANIELTELKTLRQYLN